MNRNPALVVLSILVVVTLAACAGAGAGGGGGGGGGGGSSVTPPENLVGTFALSDGSAAVMDLQIGGSTSSGSISTLATIQVTGNVRYDGADYVVAGLYDNVDGSLNLVAENTTNGDPREGWQFLFSGTYTEANGFSGTVRLLDDGGTEQATGSASAAGVSDGEKSSVETFVGTYGGSAYGAWNGVVTQTEFYGSYAASDGTGDSGTFTSSVSGGDTVSGTADNAVPFGGTISSSRDSISGWWAGTVTAEDGQDYDISGSWSGVKVDSSGDPPDVTESSDAELKANRVMQTIVSIITKAEANLDYDNLSSPANNAADVSSIDGIDSAEFDLPTWDGFTSVTIVIASEGYSDSMTGITLDQGQILATYGPSYVFSIRDATALVVDSVVQTPNDTDDGGVTVTYTDASTDNLYVNGTIDSGTSTVGGTWEVDGTDVTAVVESALF